MEGGGNTPHKIAKETSLGEKGIRWLAFDLKVPTSWITWEASRSSESHFSRRSELFWLHWKESTISFATSIWFLAYTIELGRGFGQDVAGMCG